MSSTTGVQNLLVNVFRPVYTYDPTTTLFTPKLELSNIDNYSGNTISVFRADIGDAGNNVYVGSNAGNSFTALRACSNVTAVGYGAGSNISNVSNSTYLGYYAGAGALTASNVVAIGANTNGNGISNVYVGNGSGSVGNSNVFIGAGTVGTGSGSILIGPGLSDASTNSVFKLGQTYLTGNMTTKWLGIGTTDPIDSNSRFDVSGNAYFGKQVGIQRSPERTFDVNGNFRASDSSGTLDFYNGVTSSSNGFASRSGAIVGMAPASTANIAPLKKGVVLVTASESGSASHYESIMTFCPDPTDGASCVDMTSNVQVGDITVVFQSGGSNIQISNTTTTKNVSWSVTYFPLP